MNLGARVLVIEDDPGVSAVIREVLTDEGYAVQTAPDGRSGLSAALEYDPAVILVDWRMPQMGGDEFLAAYRSAHAAPARLIVMSAAGDLPDYRALGVHSILAKPFDLEELVKRVEQALP